MSTEVGEGDLLRLASHVLRGGALCALDHVVHLCAFRVDRETVA